MGAVFIFNKAKVQDINPALDLFAEMGFSSPAYFEAGEWVIYAYSKMAINKPNFISNKGYTLITVGTPVYKGLDYTSSLEALLQDYLADDFDSEKLIGQYTILFCHDKTIEVLRDPMNCKHLFTDVDHGMFSSHMLPICQCIKTGLHINTEAFYEKLLTGIIMSPNTMFEEVIQIDEQIANCITNEDVGIGFIRTRGLQIPGTAPKNINECLDEQAETLRNYFQLLNNSGKNGIDIGLSGGYDSRLVLACLHRYYKGPIHAHSHSTENVHRNDLTIAKQMADYVGVPCHTVATRKLNHCDQIDDVLRKSILYFDGRSSFSIGGCGEVYTASYREKSTESTAFTLTGVGGELYRNVFDIGFRNIHFGQFMEDKVFSPNFRKAVQNKLYAEIKDSFLKRAAERLGIDPKNRQAKTVAHRFYCEIMMPDGQGVALDAYNQVSCCIAPFLEPRIIEKGYKTIQFHHSGGEFEGKLIEFIDSGLAAIPSSYGYPIGKRPIKAKIKERIRTYIPLFIWNRLATLATRRKDDFCIESALDELYANSQTLKKAYTFLTEMFPEINFTYFLRSNEDIRMIQFVAMTLYFFKERIKDN